MSARVNRNGIPILDPPREANRLPKACAPSRHEWRRVEQRLEEQDFAWEVDYMRVEYRCRVCGARDSEIEAHAWRPYR